MHASFIIIMLILDVKRELQRANKEDLMTFFFIRRKNIEFIFLSR